MNKIILENDEIKEIITDKKIKYEFIDNETLGIKTLKIDVLETTNLELNYEFKNTKMEVYINIKENANLNLYERIFGEAAKIRTKYFLNENSKADISKFNDIDSIKEYIIINLDGINSEINYNLKTIALKEENYDILTYHNNKSTKSEINTNGVNIKEGKINFNISSFIPKGNKKCDASQKNKIINLTDNECIIKPNLYIDEYDVTANHSAWIGTFDEQELFYLQSRGIKKQDAIKLLIDGFLTSKLNTTEQQKEEILKRINKYWR